MKVLKIYVKDLPIRLGQFLKLADAVSDGFEAKHRILSGDILVNDEPESRRGRKLHHGDVIKVDKTSYICQAE